MDRPKEKRGSHNLGGGVLFLELKWGESLWPEGERNVVLHRHLGMVLRDAGEAQLGDVSGKRSRTVSALAVGGKRGVPSTYFIRLRNSRREDRK